MNVVGFLPNRRKGVIFSFICLSLLGILPIITNSRPSGLDALTFAFYLSFWQLLSSIPILIVELRGTNKGIFREDVTKPVKKNTYTVMGITGIIFSITTFLYVFAFEKTGTINTAIAIQTYPLFAILVEAIVLRKMKNKGELSFTLILVVGIYFLATGGTWLIDDFSSWFLLALSIPLLWSIAHITIKETLAKSPITPNQVTFFRVVISSVVLYNVVICSNEPIVCALFFSISAILNVVFLSSVCIFAMVTSIFLCLVCD